MRVMTESFQKTQYNDPDRYLKLDRSIWSSTHSRGWGGGLPYESDGDACRKFQITPLKGTNLGVAQPFLAPKIYHYAQYDSVFLLFLRVQP